jgi:hypothetical protein
MSYSCGNQKCNLDSNLYKKFNYSDQKKIKVIGLKTLATYFEPSTIQNLQLYKGWTDYFYEEDSLILTNLFTKTKFNKNQSFHFSYTYEIDNVDLLMLKFDAKSNGVLSTEDKGREGSFKQKVRMIKVFEEKGYEKDIDVINDICKREGFKNKDLAVYEKDGKLFWTKMMYNYPDENTAIMIECANHENIQKLSNSEYVKLFRKQFI